MRSFFFENAFAAPERASKNYFTSPAMRSLWKFNFTRIHSRSLLASSCCVWSWYDLYNLLWFFIRSLSHKVLWIIFLPLILFNFTWTVILITSKNIFCMFLFFRHTGTQPNLLFQQVNYTNLMFFLEILH